MSNLLREYIHQILTEAKIKTADVIPGQILSIIAEHAVIEGLGGNDSFDDALNDKLVFPYFEKLKDIGVDHRTIKNKYRSLMEEIYNDCVRVVGASLTDLGIEQIKVTGGNVGVTTAKVDVVVTGQTNANPIKADVHVKFNDFARLIGLQADATGEEGEMAGKIVLNAKKLAGEFDETWPAAAKYKFLRNRFVTLSKKEGGMGFAAADVTKKSAIKQYGVEKELAVLQNPVVRSRFLIYLQENSLPQMILNEVKTFFASKGKAVYFYKFRTTPEIVNVNSYSIGEGPAVELVVDKVVANEKKLTIVENLQQTYGSTCLYILQYNDQDAFYVEARTSGEGHPMQIKMVPGADFEQIFIESEYEIVIS